MASTSVVSSRWVKDSLVYRLNRRLRAIEKGKGELMITDKNKFYLAAVPITKSQTCLSILFHDPLIVE